MKKAIKQKTQNSIEDFILYGDQWSYIIVEPDPKSPLSMYPKIKLTTVEKWLEFNNICAIIKNNVSSFTIHFTNEEDMMAFKIVFGDML